MIYKGIASIVMATVLTACGTHTTNLRQGNDVSYVSLGDQRTANAGVRVLTAGAPAGGESLGSVEAGRCHQRTTQTAPTEESVMLDLKVAAYARGADAISDVSIVKKSGLTSNCWHVLEGKANAWRMDAQAK